MIVDFAPEPGADTGVRNAPIKIIRYGREANVTAASPATAAYTQSAGATPSVETLE